MWLVGAPPVVVGLTMMTMLLLEPLTLWRRFFMVDGVDVRGVWWVWWVDWWVLLISGFNRVYGGCGRVSCCMFGQVKLPGFLNQALHVHLLGAAYLGADILWC